MAEKYRLKKTDATHTTTYIGGDKGPPKDNATVRLWFKGSDATARLLVVAINKTLAHICDGG